MAGDCCGDTPAINCLIMSEKLWGVTTNCRKDLLFWRALKENWNSRNSHCSWLNPLCFNVPVTDEALMALHALFGRPFEKALELLEASCVTYLRATGGRYVVQVCCAAKRCPMCRLNNKLFLCVCTPSGSYILCFGT